VLCQEALVCLSHAVRAAILLELVMNAENAHGT
jgi:hypothetical protein